MNKNLQENSTNNQENSTNNQENSTNNQENSTNNQENLISDLNNLKLNKKSLDSIQNKIQIEKNYKEKNYLPQFQNTKISTKTIIVATNVKFNIKKLFDLIPITSYTLPVKKRGRKKRKITEEKEKEKIIPNGSIICVKYRENLKGCPLKKKKKYDNKYFRNSLSVVMSVEKGKFINFKLSQNGKFQITGCKNEDHAIFAVKTFWGYIKKIDKENDEGKEEEGKKEEEEEKKEEGKKEEEEEKFIYEKNDNFRAIFMTVMTNIDFNLGFNINREMLDKHINSNTDYKSLLETSFGYTGVNIKFPMNSKISHKLPYIELNENSNSWITLDKTYEDYIGFLKDFEKNKELKKKRWNTFLVFHSGNVIMSGLGKCYMKEHYSIFMKIIDKSKKNIEEKLEK